MANSRGLFFEFRSRAIASRDCVNPVVLDPTPPERTRLPNPNAQHVATAPVSAKTATTGPGAGAGLDFDDATRADISIWHQASASMSTANPVALVWQGDAGRIHESGGVTKEYPTMRWWWALRIAFTIACVALGTVLILYVR